MSQETKSGIEFYGGYEVYSESGVDLTMLRETLTVSIKDRLQANARGVLFVEALQGGASTSPADEHPDAPEFAQFLQRLQSRGAEVVIVGGFAMVTQGASYTTQKLALCYARTTTTLEALAEVLASINPRLRGAPAGLSFYWNLSTLFNGSNFALATDLGFIDLLAEVPGVGAYAQVLAMADERSVCGYPVQVLSLEGLIASARAGTTARDRLHLSELEDLKILRDSAE